MLGFSQDGQHGSSSTDIPMILVIETEFYGINLSVQLINYLWRHGACEILFLDSTPISKRIVNDVLFGFALKFAVCDGLNLVLHFCLNLNFSVIIYSRATIIGPMVFNIPWSSMCCSFSMSVFVAKESICLCFPISS